MQPTRNLHAPSARCYLGLPSPLSRSGLRRPERARPTSEVQRLNTLLRIALRLRTRKLIRSLFTTLAKTESKTILPLVGVCVDGGSKQTPSQQL